jgi:hypothetical protein
VGIGRGQFGVADHEDLALDGVFGVRREDDRRMKVGATGLDHGGISDLAARRAVAGQRIRAAVEETAEPG